ncbi:MAG: hypothetical protein AAF658_02070 [Myxococcota bacterium]
MESAGRRPLVVLTLCVAGALLVSVNSSGASKKGGPLTLVPGQGIGGYSIGMPLEEARLRSSAGLRADENIRPGLSAWLTGPLRLLVDESTEKVTMIELNLTNSRGVRLGAVTLTPKMTFQEIKTHLTECAFREDSEHQILECRGLGKPAPHISLSKKSGLIIVSLGKRPKSAPHDD